MKEGNQDAEEKEGKETGVKEVYRIVIISAFHSQGYIVQAMTPKNNGYDEEGNADQEPIYQSSTPITSNLVPSSLNGSLPKVGHGAETPCSRLSSSQRP